MAYRARIDQVAAELTAGRLDAIVITHLPNVRYLCGFSGSSAVLVITTRDAVVFTDGRYRDQARTEVQGCKVKIGSGAPLAHAARWLSEKTSLRRIGIEAAHITVAERNHLNYTINKRARLVETPAFIEPMRMIKDPA